MTAQVRNPGSLLALVLVLGLTLSACGGEEEKDPSKQGDQQAKKDDGKTETAQKGKGSKGSETPGKRSRRCTTPPPQLISKIESSPRKGSIKLSSGQLVRSKDKFPEAKGFQTQAYFVSAEVKAKGIKKGAIGTWAASAPTGGKVIAVGGVANNATKLQAGVGPKRLGFGEKTDGFSESRTCVQQVAAG